jgi:ATP-dependent Clp protease, protease subunit
MQPVKETDVIYINYFDVIDMPRVNALMSFCSNLINQHNPRCLYFLFSSPGGNVSAGITFYNFLKALPCEIVMHNNGSIDSIANIIFMSAKTENRFASPHSSFLFHGVALNLPSMQLHLGKIKELASSLEKDEEKISGIIVDNTSMTKDEVNNLFTQGEVKNLEFALTKGVISNIKQSIIPENKLFINISIQTNNNA